MKEDGRSDMASQGKKEGEKKSEYTGLVPAVDQASRILVGLARNPSFKVNLTDICKTVGIHKSKGYSILNTLQKYGLVHKDPLGKTYSLGFGLISLSRKVLDNLNYEAIAGPYLEKLAEQTHSTALLGIIDNTNVFIVAKQEADRTIGVTTRIGHRFSISHGAHGKAIVSFLQEVDRERILQQDKLFFHGNASRFNRNRLDDEMKQCREDGYAVDMGELNPGINVIASPSFDSQGRLIGSIFIMGTFPESCIREHGSIVAEIAKKFSSMLGADTEQTYRKPTP
jgi:DNA-binding IclR family transcriptional regulator